LPLSVLSLNLWHDSGPWLERARRIGALVDSLQPDLIGFQEVLRGDGIDLAAELVAARGYHVDFVAASPFWRPDREDIWFGNAVASRWPVTAREELRLPDAGDAETRAALCVTVDAPVGEIAFTCTHLNWKLHHGWVRERQVAALCDFARARRPEGGFPPILVGDFNAEPDSAEIRYVSGLQSLEGRSVYFVDAWRRAGEGGPGLTWSNHNDYARPWFEPDRRIDYVFVGPPRRDGVGRVLGCRVVGDDRRSGVWPSDHFGVFAWLQDRPEPGLESL
jgi:endonuclease/exonuclease/phosphatase family metal-dependent hydrolase